MGTDIMKKHLFTVYIAVLWSIPVYCRYIYIDKKNGYPSPDGTNIGNIYLYNDPQDCKYLTEPLLEFYLWEIRKSIRKQALNLNSLSSSNDQKMQEIEKAMAEYYPLQLKPVLAEIAIDNRRNSWGYDKNNLFLRIGKDAEKYTDLYGFHANRYGRHVKTVAEEYELLVKSFKEWPEKKKIKLYGLFRAGKNPDAVIQDLVDRGAVNQKNFSGFMDLMKFADFPAVGVDPILKYWRDYVFSGEDRKYNSWRLRLTLMAMAKNKTLSDILVPELQATMQKISAAKSGWEWIGPYWCNAAGIDSPIDTVNIKKWSGLQKYSENWAIVTGNGDQAYLCRKQAFVALTLRDRFKPFSCFDLLVYDCKLSNKVISEIFNDAVSSYNRQFGFMICGRNDGKTFTPQCYPVIDKAVKEMLGVGDVILCDMQIQPVRYVIREKKLKYCNKMDAQQQKNFMNNLKFWGDLNHNYSLTGFLWGHRRDAFFNFLWENKMQRRAQDKIMAGGPLAIPMLIKIISDNKPYTSIEACDYISNMGTYAREAATGPLLIKLKQSKNRFVRGAIIRTLGEIKADASLPYLETVAYNDQDKVVRTNALHVLMLFKKLTLKDVEKIYEDRKRKALNHRIR